MNKKGQKRSMVLNQMEKGEMIRRKPHHALDENLRKRELELAGSTYAGCNNQHFTELLDEREGITVSRSLVRLILLGAEIKNPRKRCPPRHRSRRECYLKEGMLVQIDGSLAVYYQGYCLATKPAPPEAPVLRARKADRLMPSVANFEKPTLSVIVTKNALQPKSPYHSKPVPDHPWRRPFKVHIDRG